MVYLAAVVKETDEGRMTLPITNEIMDSMGVDQQQLKETALANISDQDYSFKSMRDVSPRLYLEYVVLVRF